MISGDMSQPTILIANDRGNFIIIIIHQCLAETVVFDPLACEYIPWHFTPCTHHHLAANHLPIQIFQSNLACPSTK